MRGKLIFILLLMVGGMCVGQDTWKKEKIKLPHPLCYASQNIHHSYIHPPSEYLEQLKSGATKKATIDVTYVGFSAEAQQAFQYAVDIWENLIYSPVPIRVKAYWQSLSKSVLASCGPEGFYKNFNSTQIWNCYYPVALVEKMLGQEVNGPTDFEISATFNKDFTNWYFGTDGKTPPNQYDFVSTVMHELAHGLGFSGFFYTDRGRGGYGYGSDSFSAVFDQFVENKGGDRLTNTNLYANPSIVLYQNLTSGWLNFDNRQPDSNIPRLYAPSTWDSGSSIYHLDDATYSSGDANSLMTPFTGMGEAIHDPGPNTLEIINEMGWKSLSIKHKPLKDIEFLSSPIPVEAQIEADNGLDSTSIYLHYSTNQFIKTDSILLKASATPLIFAAQLPKNLSGTVRYYFSASDKKKKKYVFPSNSPTRYMSFKIGIDKEAPVLTHDPIKYVLTTSPLTRIDVIATDNIGIKSVKMEYFINGGIIKTLDLAAVKDDIFTANLIFQAGTVKDGDRVSYRIVATDQSSQNNIGRTPLSGYYSFTIEGFQNPVERYVNNFDQNSNDFITSDFKITTVSGFDNPALNSAHPYLSPDTDNMNFNFTAMLKYPIILKAGGKMTYDEVVLVEPGETGTKFGDEEFWDYVIVEGSTDMGNTWKPLTDGYDSNAQKSWFDVFNSSMSGQNSLAIATKDLFVKREIDMLSNRNFKAGDTILVRFRLFSDPYAHGWGWIIDNLTIQDFNTTMNSLMLSSGEVMFYPNPASSRLTLQITNKENLNRFTLKASNSSGVLVYNQIFEAKSNVFETYVDISNFSPGLYLFSLQPEKGGAINRKILIQ